MPMPVSATIIAGALVTRMLTRPRSVYLTALDSSWWRMNSSHLLIRQGAFGGRLVLQAQLLADEQGRKVANRLPNDRVKRHTRQHKVFVGLPSRA